MKCKIFVLVVFAVLLFVSCNPLGNTPDPEYVKFMGTWNVTGKPSDWDDVKYIFTFDRMLEIYHESNGEHLSQKYTVDSITDKNVLLSQVYCESDLTPVKDTLMMAYILSNSNKSLQVGFYLTVNEVTWCLDLEKQ